MSNCLCSQIIVSRRESGKRLAFNASRRSAGAMCKFAAANFHENALYAAMFSATSPCVLCRIASGRTAQSVLQDSRRQAGAGDRKRGLFSLRVTLTTSCRRWCCQLPRERRLALPRQTEAAPHPYETWANVAVMVESMVFPSGAKDFCSVRLGCEGAGGPVRRYSSRCQEEWAKGDLHAASDQRDPSGQYRSL